MSYMSKIGCLLNGAFFKDTLKYFIFLPNELEKYDDEES